MVWTNETGGLSVEMTMACSAAEVGGFAILPAPCSFESWPGLERKGQGVGFQVRGLETISTPRRRSGS